MNDDQRYVTRYGGTASIRTLRRVLRGLAAVFFVFMLIILVTESEEELALFLIALGGTAFCLLLAAFPRLLGLRTPNGSRIPLRTAPRQKDSES